MERENDYTGSFLILTRAFYGQPYLEQAHELRELLEMAGISAAVITRSEWFASKADLHTAHEKMKLQLSFHLSQNTEVIILALTHIKKEHLDRALRVGGNYGRQLAILQVSSWKDNDELLKECNICHLDDKTAEKLIGQYREIRLPILRDEVFVD